VLLSARKLHFGLIWGVIGLFCLSPNIATAQSANVQKQTVADNDLKAIYCAVVLKKLYYGVQSYVNSLPENVKYDPSIQDKLRVSRDNYERVLAYIAPKLELLDSDSLLAAAQRAANDLTEVERADDCSTLISDQTSFSTCAEKLAQNPAIARVRRCNDLSWLPF